MGAWGEGMQANDTALDYIAKYQDYDAKDDIPLNRRGKEVLSGKRSLNKELQNIVHGEKGWSHYTALGVLGVAEFFLDQGHDLKGARRTIMTAIRHELSDGDLESWRSPATRKAALLRFKARAEGKDVPAELIERDNEGLLSKIHRRFAPQEDAE